MTTQLKAEVEHSNPEREEIGGFRMAFFVNGDKNEKLEDSDENLSRKKEKEIDILENDKISPKSGASKRINESYEVDKLDRFEDLEKLNQNLENLDFEEDSENLNCSENHFNTFPLYPSFLPQNSNPNDTNISSETCLNINNIKNCLSSDLLQKIEEGSPIKPCRKPHREMSAGDIYMSLNNNSESEEENEPRMQHVNYHSLFYKHGKDEEGLKTKSKSTNLISQDYNNLFNCEDYYYLNDYEGGSEVEGDYYENFERAKIPEFSTDRNWDNLKFFTNPDVHSSSNPISSCHPNSSSNFIPYSNNQNKFFNFSNPFSNSPIKTNLDTNNINFTNNKFYNENNFNNFNSNYFREKGVTGSGGLNVNSYGNSGNFFNNGSNIQNLDNKNELENEHQKFYRENINSNSNSGYGVNYGNYLNSNNLNSNCFDNSNMMTEDSAKNFSRTLSNNINEDVSFFPKNFFNYNCNNIMNNSVINNKDQKEVYNCKNNNIFLNNSNNHINNFGNKFSQNQNQNYNQNKNTFSQNKINTNKIQTGNINFNKIFKFKFFF